MKKDKNDSRKYKPVYRQSELYQMISEYDGDSILPGNFICDVDTVFDVANGISTLLSNYLC